MPVIKTSNILAYHWLSVARDKKTQAEQFRAAMENIGVILFNEAINDVKALTLKRTIKTPLTRSEGRFIDSKNVFLIPVLRAGLSMLGGVKKLVPDARVAHVGLYRNEKTLQPKWYLDKLPKKITKNSVFFILEPMLATGGTITTVLQRVIILGVTRVYVLGALISQETKEKLEKKFPTVCFYVAGIDPQLNTRGYIVPGLGDAGDRAFNM